MRYPVVRSRLMLLGLAAIGAGCSANRGTVTNAGSEPVRTPSPAMVAGNVRATCTVSPECPPAGTKGTLTTVRSGHTWTVENNTAQARDFVVVLEISDSLGHAKRKEVPGQVKAHAKVEDSTSITLVTTYQQAGAVDAQAKTTVRLGEQNLAQNAQNCGFEIR